MKHFTIICLFLLSLAHPSLTDPIPISEWDLVIKGKSLEDILQAVRNGQIEQWPFIHSASELLTSSNVDNQKQLEFQNECKRIITEVMAFNLRPNNDLSGFTDVVTSLLQWRDILYRRPSYYNLLLADTINRYLILRFVDNDWITHKPLPVELYRLVSSSRINSFPSESLLHFVNRIKYSDSIIVTGVLSHASIEINANIYRSLWTQLRRSDSILQPTNLILSATTSLISVPDTPLLLNRYIKSDSLLRLVEMLYDYLIHEPHASIYDTHEQIARYYPINSRTTTTLTPHGAVIKRSPFIPSPFMCVEEVLAEQEFGSINIVGLLTQIISGRLDSISNFTFHKLYETQ
ncbi:MAG TPA: hypothetical protein PKE26_15055 [Kiritimatiellia bacterium]|nr:hypothetical protein [Kiritimatiellia bacterium]HMP00415.1 hypothetical protein [Kiritimatiellia bacterium]